MFCSNCGKEAAVGALFCDQCGAGLGDQAARSNKPAGNQQAPTTTAPVRPAEPPVAIKIVKAALQLLLAGLFLYWFWYSYGCATGKYPDTGDQACRWFAQVFSVKNVQRQGGNGGGGGCVPTGCGSRWHSSCTNKCYVTQGDCRQSGSDCSGNVTCRQCP